MPTGGADSFFDLEQAAESQAYCDDIAGTLAEHGLEITELSTHLQGQLVAVHPAYDELFDGFAPPEVRGKPAERQAWAVRPAEGRGQGQPAARPDRARHLLRRAGLALSSIPGRSGRRAWSRRRSPSSAGAGGRSSTPSTRRASTPATRSIPGEDLHDGATFERFLDEVGDHPRANILYDPSHFVLQQLDYLDFIDRYHERIRAFHVKDAEFRPDRPLRRLWRLSGLGRPAGPLPLAGRRPGRFRRRSSPSSPQYDYPGWAVLEWECALKHPEDGAREGAPFIRDHIIRVTDHAFDDFAGSGADAAAQPAAAGPGGI